MRLCVSGVGRLVKNPEISETQTGKKLAKFTIACSDGKEDACFYYCFAYGQTAEFVAKYFCKGKPIAIQGEWGQFASTKDNQKHSFVDVKSVDFVPSEAKTTQGEQVKKQASEEDDVPF